MRITDIFAADVFTTEELKKRMSAKAYEDFESCRNKDLPLEIANEVADAMKNWAISKGATHFSHWFQPLTGISAQKQDSFLCIDSDSALNKFSGKDLIKGEPDASSFPNGGLRSTFEARGYTVWDRTSPAFIIDDVICIPTAFCSYNGDALDTKTPLLRSMEAINKQGLRLLELFGIKADGIRVNVGAEQEYFLIDSEVYKKRKDLVYTGRTLWGARPPKGQELQDHYLGTIRPRVAQFMKDLDRKLWRLGIPAKTRHNEVAPCQYEFAPVFTTVNLACDQNRITMELMQTTARQHGFVCLLHEKPFSYINGSGKHNNWSICTDDGKNLFESGCDCQYDALFLLSLAAVIAAVDEHQDLLRIAAASASNDLRLGGNEAPPAIVSIYLGNELTGILQAVADGRTYSNRAKCDVEIGVRVLPKISPDSADRNRTSPFAFTGNKFEFRMSGSSQSIAEINTILNTIVAQQFRIFAKRLEKKQDLNACVKDIIRDTMRAHGNIIFNGNNYSKAWIEEAKRRGLLNFNSTPDALSCMTEDKNIRLFEEFNVFTSDELISRKKIRLENYCKTINIEALTMLDIVRRDIIPYIMTYKSNLAVYAKSCADAGIDAATELSIALKLEKILTKVSRLTDSLSSSVETSAATENVEDRAKLYRQCVLEKMRDLRQVCDEAEKTVPQQIWKIPDYAQILLGDE